VKLVIGLGNPGSRYRATRHNVGFRVTERFAERVGIDPGGERFGGRFCRGRIAVAGKDDLDVGILQPGTFMNLSGDSVAAALRALPVHDPSADLLVVLDDVDLAFGRLRLRPGGGGGGHKGLTHIIERLGRSDLPRLRFGVGRPAAALSTTEYVLQRFSPEEERDLEGRVEEAAEAVEVVLREGLGPAMNRYNRDPDAEA
jgi:PTH1 family peptidyl-tRNA hydrolase